MRRLLVVLLALLGLASAQGAIGMRFGYGEGLGLTFGAGMENRLRQNLSGRLAADLAPEAPGVALEAPSSSSSPTWGSTTPPSKASSPTWAGGSPGWWGPPPPWA